MLSYHDLEGRRASKTSSCKNLLVCSAICAFVCGLTVGVVVATLCFDAPSASPRLEAANDTHVTFVDNSQHAIVSDDIFWGPTVEAALPDGFQPQNHSFWEKYMKKATATKLLNGCGRMQNRLVVFSDGRRGCVRYRQNTDQIQGELFSFYLAQILQLRNLAPSTVSVVDLKNPLWSGLSGDVAAAQWNANKPVVVTQYIDNLGVASIPQVFKPSERHLDKHDVFNMTAVLGEQEALTTFVELAQWSDLIVFDYLTANLDRIVNNLYNFQWNVNIMDAPAHNLARRPDSNLLLFLDNESGLLHGYRLLKKYEVYHNVLLENLCVFRRRTVDVIERLKRNGDVGTLLRDFFEKNTDTVKDILPMLPEKSLKILNERIDKVFAQVTKCRAKFA